MIEHCGTCARYVPVARIGFGNCRLMPGHRLVSCMFACHLRPSQWQAKTAAAASVP